MRLSTFPRRSIGDLVSLSNQSPTAILPDAALPPALRRNTTGTIIYTANQYDAQIAQESAQWQWIAQHGGLKSCCRIPELGAPLWSQPPWQVMPSNGNPFQFPFALNTTAIPFDGANHLIGSFEVENGYDGALTGVYPNFNGTGFVEGSGGIVWRVLIGQRYGKTLGNMLFAFTDLATASALRVPGSSWRLVSGQSVQVFANIPAVSPVSGGQVGCVLTGWRYPRR